MHPFVDVILMVNAAVGQNRGCWECSVVQDGLCLGRFEAFEARHPIERLCGVWLVPPHPLRSTE